MGPGCKGVNKILCLIIWLMFTFLPLQNDETFEKTYLTLRPNGNFF